MLLNKLDSDFLKYLITKQVSPGDRLPPLNDMSQEMGISVGKLREQLELARRMGMVSVRPRVGIVRETYDFCPAVLLGVMFGLGSGEASFAQFSQVRVALELAFWDTAVAQLTPQDKDELRHVVSQAWRKLRGDPVHVPNGEHRQLHLKIFSRLDNPFVLGLLDAYWDAYEASELTRFASYQYWVTVWRYHERIVEAIAADDIAAGRQLLSEHFDLLPTVSDSV